MVTMWAWALGAFTVIGLPGFVTASDLDAMKNQQTVLAERSKRFDIRSLEDSLLETRKAQCLATDKTYATKRLAELRRDYRDVTGQSWDVPTCDEVGVK